MSIGILGFFGLLIIFVSLNCNNPQQGKPLTSESSSLNPIYLPRIDTVNWTGNEALVGTRFKSLDDLKAVVRITYAHGKSGTTLTKDASQYVRLTHRSGMREVTSILMAGISQTDFMRAKKGTLYDKILLSLKCPYALFNRKNLISIEHLGRREPELFGIGDAAFLDLAEIMDKHISEEDRRSLPTEDFTEKGYLNSFNHITAQALMTSIFSERLADFVADVHELYNMPELITGKFTDAQLNHPVDSPIDNYIDMINNEWGQELGKVLTEKYSINRKTVWNPELMSNYLNDIQSYCSWAFRIQFKPFRPTDKKVIRFAEKINIVLA